jgi:hypothetical protein
MTIYQQLISEPVEYLICVYGKGNALGFRGEQEYITKAYNLFANMDCEGPANRSAPLLVEIDKNKIGLSYIYTTIPRISKALELFFYTNILLNREVPVWSTWDEETGEYNLIQDTESAEKLSKEYAARFMTEHIKIESFIPRIAATQGTEYSLAEVA